MNWVSKGHIQIEGSALVRETEMFLLYFAILNERIVLEWLLKILELIERVFFKTLAMDEIVSVISEKTGGEIVFGGDLAEAEGTEGITLFERRGVGLHK
jgi:hypothetical protein